LEYGSLKRILPDDSTNHLEDLYIYSELENLFAKIGGIRNADSITSSQFQKLSKVQGLTSQKLMKAQYDIIYRNTIKKHDISTMDLNAFFDAIEIIANKVINSGNAYDDLRELLTLCDKVKRF
jgi:hypothetical protein